MGWYIVKIVYRIICGEGNHTPQFDEQIRIILAENSAEAVEKGKRIGQQEEETFLNEKAQLVQWKFINVTELHPLNQLIDGAEVFSQIIEIEQAIDYCNFTHHKNALLEKQISSMACQTA